MKKQKKETVLCQSMANIPYAASCLAAEEYYQRKNRAAQRRANIWAGLKRGAEKTFNWLEEWTVPILGLTCILFLLGHGVYRGFQEICKYVVKSQEQEIILLINRELSNRECVTRYETNSKGWMSYSMYRTNVIVNGYIK